MGFMWAEVAKEPRMLQVHKHPPDHLCLDGWKVEVDVLSHWPELSAEGGTGASAPLQKRPLRGCRKWVLPFGRGI